MANSIDGRVVDAATRSSGAGLIVEAVSATRGDSLGRAAANVDGAFSIPVDVRRFRALIANAESVTFRVTDPDAGPFEVVEVVDDPGWNGGRPDVHPLITVRTGRTGGDPAPRVTGVVTDGAGVAAAGLSVQAWDHDVAGPVQVAAGVSGDDGRYDLTYQRSALRGKAAADLEVRVVGADGNVLTASRILFAAPEAASVDVVVERADVPSPAEYDRLLATVGPLLGGRGLADVDPGSVGYLSGRTGWDPRTVAMAAQAATLSAQSQIPAAHYYALLRTGLPGAAEEIHRLDDAALTQALKQGVATGVIADDGAIEETVALHRAAAVTSLSGLRPAGTVSSLGELMSLRLDRDQQATMIDALRSAGGDPATLWGELEQRGFDAPTLTALQTDAVLGDLTRQNAPLIGRLTGQAQVASAAELADRGLYRAEAWTGLIGTDVPEGLTAQGYAEGLAAQVAARFPTRVSADLVRSGAVDVGAAQPEVADFLAARGEDAAIGIAPVRTWAGFDALSPAGRDGALKVERLYQITPSNDAMTTLSRLGIDSALQVTTYSRGGFVAAFGDAFPSTREAELVHAKALQVHTTALSVATAYLTYRRAPNVYAITGTTTTTVPAPGPAIAASATLENLFDSMDYCTCDHCRSVLSPAAYLVELLEMLDLGDVPHQLEDPQTVLLSRRPDLAHIALSCENTNVALPYLDIVLEILEYWVVNGNLTAFAGHDVRPDAETADLLADPEFVIDAAYDSTKGAVYPPGLPFDAPLEQLRLLFEVWDTSLPAALDVFGTPPEARQEWLRLNAAERSILTDVGFRALPEYFGEPAGATIEALNDVIGNARTFCRRLQIAYTDLAAILTSRFVNPGIVLLRPLEALRVSLAQLQQRYDGTLSDADLLALLPADLDPAAYGAGVPAWLDDHRDLIMGLITLTDMTPPGEPVHAGDFGTVDLRFALPNTTANRLTEIAYHRLHRFVRLWRTLGWSIAQTDTAITAFLGADPATLTTATVDAAMAGLLDRLAGFTRFTTGLGLSAKKVMAWLALFDPALEAGARHEQLAALLRIGGTDLADLLEITGLDPFADDLGTDAPSLPALVEAVTALKASPLKVADVDYLLRHADRDGRLAPAPEDLIRDVLALRAALSAVDADLAVPSATADPPAVAAKMTLVYDQVVVDRFLALIAGTTNYAAPLDTTEEVLPPAVAAAAPSVRIDPFHRALTCTGPLEEATRAAAATAAGALVLADVETITAQADLDTFKARLVLALQGLRDDAVSDLDALGADYPDLRALYDTLLAASLLGGSNPAAQATAILSGILTRLRAALRATALRTTLANLTKSTVEIVDALTPAPVPADLTGIEAPPGLDADGTVDLLLHPPANDEYLLYVQAPPGTQVTLVVDGGTAIATTAVGPDGELRTASGVALPAGTLVPASLTMSGLPAGARAQLWWRTDAVAKAPVPPERLYRADALATARRSLLRLHKAVQLAGSLGLTAAEVADLGGVRPDTAGLFGELDVDGGSTPAQVHGQWARLAWLLWFTALKARYEQEENTLLGALQAPAAKDARGRYVLAGLLEWAPADLDAVLTAFGLTVDELGGLTQLRRVRTALDLVAGTLQPAADLLAWTTGAPDGALVRTVRATLRARMDEASWRESMQSVTDQARNARRDALVAYVLHHASPSPEIQTADELYEYFLVDVQMDACMQTSRIRLALSTVQLFVNRCLLNLEPRVSPGSINAEHWSWMRRYRVWEANRKVFLYPENWLEPELRDGKSPFFRDLESELLKADITQDLAESAYLHYLQKLDDVARLEIAGAYLEPRTPGTTDDDVLHVIGRTLGATREHWYRRHEYGYWTPWEKVGLNIEGDLVVPVIWKKRLFVFWATTVVQALGNPGSTPRDVADHAWSSESLVEATVTLHRGEYYDGRWSSPKTTETTTALTLGPMPSFDPAKLRAHTKTYTPAAAAGTPPLSERLEVWLGYLGSSTIATYYLTFTSTNSAPHVRADDPFWVHLGRDAQMLALGRTPYPDVDANSWVYDDRDFTVRVEQPVAPKNPLPMHVLTKAEGLMDGFRVRPVVQDGEAGNPWELPLFYSDERSVFFVSGDESQYRRSTHYFVDDVVLTRDSLQDYAKLVQTPVRPVIPRPGDPVIDPGSALRLAGDATVTFGGTVFDAGGIARVQNTRIRNDG